MRLHRERSFSLRHAERQRRYIARLKAAAKQAQGSVTNAQPCTACTAKDRELARLRVENADLHRRSQQGPKSGEAFASSEKKSKHELKPAGRTEWSNPRDPLSVANAKIASMRGEIRELQAKLKVKVEMPRDVGALQRQLMAAKTELQ